MKNLVRRIPVPVRMLIGFLLVIATVSWMTGEPMFREFSDRTWRTVEKRLPIPSTGERARKKLRNRLAEADLVLGQPAFIRIFKQEAELEVWLRDPQGFRLLHTYPICKSSGFLGPKLQEGDKQSPEGFYAITKRQLNPGSRHYRAFNIGFPNEFDRAHGRTGSALMVHGGCSSVGCYAMTDVGIGEIYRVVERALMAGQKRVPVHIFPFRMTRENINRHPTGKWTGFWENLKTGHDLFEATQQPPRTGACGKRYVFGQDVNNCQMIAGW